MRQLRIIALHQRHLPQLRSQAAMSRISEADVIRRGAHQALAASKVLRAVGASKLADLNRRDAAELNAAAREAEQEGHDAR